jgi:hypothetical protein
MANTETFSATPVSVDAAVAAVAVKYNTAIGISISGSVETVIAFNSKIYDPDGDVTTIAPWKFIAPRTGNYRVSAHTMFDASAWTLSATGYLFLRKNGVNVENLGYFIAETTVSVYRVLAGSTTIALVAGDYINVIVYQNNAGAKSLIASSHYNWINIEAL